MQLARSALNTVNVFARSMGVEAHLADDGACSFDFERSGRLSVVQAEDGSVLVSLTRRIILEGTRNLALWAGQGGISDLDGTAAHVGLNKAGQPVMAFRFRPEDFDPAGLENAFAALGARFENLRL